MTIERCSRCKAQLYEDHDACGFIRIVCYHGHTVRYESPDGEVTEAGRVVTPVALLSTREWALAVIGPELLADVESQSEGAYGAWN